MTADQPPGGPERRFPVLDEEPPVPSLWRRMVMPASAAVFTAAVVAGVILWPSQAPGTHPAPKRQTQLTDATGRIMAVSPTGSLVVSDPAGQSVRKLTSLGTVGYPLPPSPDNRYFSLGNGQIIAASGNGLPARLKTPITLFNVNLEGDTLGSFADHDRELVGLYIPIEGTETQFRVQLYSLATGKMTRLGLGHQVAGDPQGPGAFVSVAGKPTATTVVVNVDPDSRVELQRPGQPPLVLATAQDLNRDLHQSPGLPVALTPYPSPSGNEVAVAVQPEYGSTNSDIAVLTRTGKVVATIPGSGGAAANNDTMSFSSQIQANIITWSPSGSAFAYIAKTASGPALRIWSAGGRLRTEALPSGTGAAYRFCLWSPDGQSLLCSVGDPGQQWVITTMAGRTTTALRGTGTPVAWLP